MKNIVVVSNYQDEISARPEAEIFISLAKRGIGITVLTQGNSTYSKKFKKAGIKVIDHTPERKVSWATIKLLRKVIKESSASALFLYNSKAIVNGILATFFNREIEVIVYRGCAGNISWIDPTAYFKYLNPRVDKVICNAWSAKNLLDRQFTFDSRKTIVIHKGHSIDWYDQNATIDSDVNISEETFTVCCVANSRPVKGIEYLLESFKYLDANLDIKLLLMGNGHDNARNKKIIANTGNADKIKILGYRNDSQAIVSKSDVFVLPSIGQETLTKSIIEAMCLNTPVIATDVEGNKKLLRDQETALVVPIKNAKAIGEALLLLYNNKTLGEKLANNALQNIKQELSHTNTVDQYEELILKQ